MAALLRDSDKPVVAEELQICGRAAFAARHVGSDRILIVVTGEVDATNRQAFGCFVERHIRVSKQLVLDLSGVGFFGSQGFTVLHYVSVHCERRDVDWMLVGNRSVRRILGVCDPDGELPLVDSRDTALARLNHLARRRRVVSSVGRTHTRLAKKRPVQAGTG